MADPESAFITLEPTLRPGYFLVVVKRPTRDDWFDARVSHEPLTKVAAEALAKSWAAAMQLEIR